MRERWVNGGGTVTVTVMLQERKNHCIVYRYYHEKETFFEKVFKNIVLMVQKSPLFACLRTVSAEIAQIKKTLLALYFHTDSLWTYLF